MTPRPKCTDCGLPLSTEAWAAGLCLPCLAGLAQRGSWPRNVRASKPPIQDEPAQDESVQDELSLTRIVSPGEILGDRFRIRSLLGVGGMAEVWLAFDLKLRVDVALKSLRTDLAKVPGAADSLHREVRLGREVISPNVCRVFDLQEIDDREWISMEYLPGASLKEILDRRGPLELDEAGDIAAQFLDGLEAIHDAGFLHLDIKPDNLMITQTGRVVVTDFGIVKHIEAGRAKRIAGSWGYMSPEQSRGEALDARADIFSAGLVLAEMITPPAEDALVRPHCGSALRLSDTPWTSVIEQAVAPDRERRMKNVSELFAALKLPSPSTGCAWRGRAA